MLSKYDSLRYVTKNAHLRQWKKAEESLAYSASSAIDNQISQVSSYVAENGIDRLHSEFTARSMTAGVIRSVASPLASAMAKAMVMQLRLIGYSGLKSKASRTKASTASEFLLGFESEYYNYGFEYFGSAPLEIRLSTEYPEWMRKSIVKQLNETFSQPYWLGIGGTTLGDIDKVVADGVSNGWSVSDMASAMREKLGGGRYGAVRGRRIARTEAGHALNGARVNSIDALSTELGADLPVVKTWLSVLGTTTRASHANTDGVPADKNGLWYLSGYYCRWPGDVSLPASERANCQCTVSMALGMQQGTADSLIQDYMGRIQEYDNE